MARKDIRKISVASRKPQGLENTTEMIRKKAYEIYEKKGKVSGRDLDNWLEAERTVLENFK